MRGKCDIAWKEKEAKLTENQVIKLAKPIETNENQWKSGSNHSSWNAGDWRNFVGSHGLNAETQSRSFILNLTNQRIKYILKTLSNNSYHT